MADISYTVAIRCNATGEIRYHRDELGWHEASDYQWLDGNYACDCNRALFFARAKGEDDPDQVCGDTAYTALYAELDDGEKITLDDEPITPRN